MEIRFFQFAVTEWARTQATHDSIYCVHYYKTLAEAMPTLKMWEDKEDVHSVPEDGVNYAKEANKARYQYHQSFVDDKGQAVIRLQQERADLDEETGRLDNLEVRYISITEIVLP